MPKIREEKTYTLQGNDFKSLGEVKAHVENQLGAILNGLPQPFTRLDVLDLLVGNRRELINLLQIEYEATTACSDWHGVKYEDRNILDHTE